MNGMEGNAGPPSHECLGMLCSHVIESRVEVGYQGMSHHRD